MRGAQALRSGVILCTLCWSTGQLVGAEAIDAESLQPGGRIAADGLELSGHFGGAAGLVTSEGTTLAGGYTGQIANQVPTLAAPPRQVVSEDSDHDVAYAAADADGDRLIIVIIEQPAHGTLDGDGPTFLYTPDAGYRGPDSFVVRVHDGADRSRDRRVYLLVGGVRRIVIHVHPSPTDLVRVDAVELPDGSVLSADYDPDGGSVLDYLERPTDHLLVPVFGGDG